MSQAVWARLYFNVMPVKESLTPSKPQSFSSLSEQVRHTVTNSVDKVLGSATYDASKVPAWVDSITAEILDYLQKLSEEFKYVVTVVMLQRSNTGFHLFSTCFWDQTLDGTVTVQWENKTMHCVVTVFGVAL